MPGMRRGAKIRGAGIRIERVGGSVPAVEIAAILDGEVYAADEGRAAIYDGALLVERLRDVEQRAARFVEPALDATLLQEALLLRRVVDHVDRAAWVVGIPQQHAHVDAATCRKSEHIHDAELPAVHRAIAASSSPAARRRSTNACCSGEPSAPAR